MGKKKTTTREEVCPKVVRAPSLPEGQLKQQTNQQYIQSRQTNQSRFSDNLIRREQLDELNNEQKKTSREEDLAPPPLRVSRRASSSRATGRDFGNTNRFVAEKNAATELPVKKEETEALSSPGLFQNCATAAAGRSGRRKVGADAMTERIVDVPGYAVEYLIGPKGVRVSAMIKAVRACTGETVGVRYVTHPGDHGGASASLKGPARSLLEAERRIGLAIEKVGATERRFRRNSSAVEEAERRAAKKAVFPAHRTVTGKSFEEQIEARELKRAYALQIKVRKETAAADKKADQDKVIDSRRKSARFKFLAEEDADVDAGKSSEQIGARELKKAYALHIKVRKETAAAAKKASQDTVINSRRKSARLKFLAEEEADVDAGKSSEQIEARELKRAKAVQIKTKKETAAADKKADQDTVINSRRKSARSKFLAASEAAADGGTKQLGESLREWRTKEEGSQVFGVTALPGGALARIEERAPERSDRAREEDEKSTSWSTSDRSIESDEKSTGSRTAAVKVAKKAARRAAKKRRAGRRKLAHLERHLRGLGYGGMQYPPV